MIVMISNSLVNKYIFSLFFSDDQNELVRTALATGKPVIVYIYVQNFSLSSHSSQTSGALNIAEIFKTVPAVLTSSYNGMMTGTAFAETLFGLYTPAGIFSSFSKPFSRQVVDHLACQS